MNALAQVRVVAVGAALVALAACGSAAPAAKSTPSETSRVSPLGAALPSWGSHFVGPKTITAPEGGPGYRLNVKVACVGPGILRIENAAGRVLGEILGCTSPGSWYTATAPWPKGKDQAAVRIVVSPTTRWTVEVDLHMA